MSRHATPYQATPKIERDLGRTGQAQLEGGQYRATVATASTGYFEAWTGSLPFVYGRPASTFRGALDNLEAQVCEVEAERRAV